MKNQYLSDRISNIAAKLDNEDWDSLYAPESCEYECKYTEKDVKSSSHTSLTDLCAEEKKYYEEFEELCMPLSEVQDTKVSSEIVHDIWNLSQNFSTTWIPRSEFKNDFHSLIENLKKSNTNTDPILNKITDNLDQIKNGFNDQSIELDTLKNNLQEISDSLNSYAGFKTNEILNDFNKISETINENDLQYMIDAYQTDSIA